MRGSRWLRTLSSSRTQPARTSCGPCSTGSSVFRPSARCPPVHSDGEREAFMLAPGSHVGDYILVRRAAIGGTSEVYEGRHVGNGRTVAVKVLHAEWCLHLEVVARFLNEAHALQRILHP